MAVKKGELRHIHIEPLDDGTITSRVSKKPSNTKQKGAWLMDESEEKGSHTTPEEAGKHVTEILRQHFAKGAPAAKDGAAKKKNPRAAGETGDEQSFPSDNGPAANED